MASTYKAILDNVSRDIMTKADVRLSTRVSGISTTKGQNGDPRVFVRTSNGVVSDFDEVVVTSPLGWLKRNTQAFTPPLPPRILEAIENINYGRLEKVYISFPTAFWDGPQSLESEPTTETESSTPQKYPLFSHFLHPAYTPTQNPQGWNIELVSLSALPDPTAHPTLLFYIQGPCATHITSLTRLLPPHSPAYKDALTQFFQPYYSLLPHYDPTSQACTPTAALATDWLNDDLAGNGSYTNFQTSDDEAGVQLDADIEALRESEGCGVERGMWFAGEHTAPFVASGTVTGAWWSGEGIGRRVAGLYGLGDGEGAGAVDVGGKGEREGEGESGDENGEGKDGEKDVARDGSNINGIVL